MDMKTQAIEMLYMLSTQGAARQPAVNAGKDDFRRMLEQTGKRAEEQPAPDNGQAAPQQTDLSAPEEQGDTPIMAQTLAAGLFMAPESFMWQPVIPAAPAPDAGEMPVALDPLAGMAAQGTQQEQAGLPVMADLPDTAPEAAPTDAISEAVPDAAPEAALPMEGNANALPARPVEAREDGAEPVNLRQNAPQAQTTVETAPRQDGQEDLPERLTAADAAPQQPFRDVEAVPIKVGEAAPSETEVRPEEVGRQLVGKITASLENGESKVEIRLKPEHLGDVTVELTRDSEGALHVVLTPERAATGELLERHITSLQTALGGNEREPVQISVQRQQGERQEQSYDGRGGQSNQGQRQEQQREAPRRHAYEFLQQLQLGMEPMTEPVF